MVQVVRSYTDDPSAALQYLTPRHTQELLGV